jgi:hypothetical protein
MSVSQLRDIIAIEHNEGEPFSRLTSTYEMIRDTAAANPEARITPIRHAGPTENGWPM